MCRKVAEAKNGDEIEIWGDGEQTRSFLFIDECLEGTLRLTRSGHTGPLNIGSEEMVTINQLADMVMEIAGKKLTKRHVPGPLGVRGRNSDNRLISETLNWAPSRNLRDGLEVTYQWIEAQVRERQQMQRATTLNPVRETPRVATATESASTFRDMPSPATA